jgi:hypothetical protein
MKHNILQELDLKPPRDSGIALARRLSNRKAINLQELQDRNVAGE